MNENLKSINKNELIKNLPNGDVVYWKNYYTEKTQKEDLTEKIRVIYEKKLEIIALLERQDDKKENIIPSENTNSFVEEEDNKEHPAEIIDIETSPDVEIVTKEQPDHVIVDQIIKNSITENEEVELKNEFPEGNTTEIIKKEVVKELNDKKPKGNTKKENLTILGKIRKRTRKTFLLLMAVGSFGVITSFSSPRSKDSISYDKVKVENLDDWEQIKLNQDEINNLDNISIINTSNENSNEKYLIIDKQNGKTFLYQGDSLIRSYNVCLGDSLGDEQTKLKSTYGKILEQVDEENYIINDASIDEATYTENGERYLKSGYKAFTEWGKGNMKTGAGIYEVSNKGPFLKDVGLFLKNERGEQVATSLHYNSHFKESDTDFRISNGCVGFTKEDIHEIYESVPIGSKVYVLPDNPHNKFKIIDGQLRFVSNEKDVNKTIKPYEAKPIILKADNINDDGREFLTFLSTSKKDLMKLYPTVSNDVYNKLAKIAYGIFGQESSFGTYGKFKGKIGQVTDIAGTLLGQNVSVGWTQIRITSVSSKVRDFFNIKNTDDLYNHKKCVVATMAVMMDAYVNAIPNSKKNDFEKLIPLFYNSPNDNFKKALVGQEANYDYSNKVLKYSQLAKIYTQNN